MNIVSVVKNRLMNIAILLVLASLVACSTITVNTDFDIERDFNNLSTYAWMEPKREFSKDPLVDNDLMNKRVRRAVENQLASLGFVKAEGDNGADFFITYHVSAETRFSISSYHSNFGYYPFCWNSCYGHGHRYGYDREHDISVRQYKQGTFMLDVIEPATSELIWRGVAGRRLNNGTPQQRDIYIDEIVTAILAQFPPSTAM